MTSTPSPLIGSSIQSYIEYEWTIPEQALNEIDYYENCQLRSRPSHVPRPGYVSSLKYGLYFGKGEKRSIDDGKAIVKFEFQNVHPEDEYEANLYTTIKSAKVSAEVHTNFNYQQRSFTFVLCDKWEQVFDKNMGFLNDDQKLVIKLKGVITGGEKHFIGEKRLPPMEECLKMYQNQNVEKIHIDVQGQKIWLDHEIYDQMLRHSCRHYLRFIVSDFPYKIVEKGVLFNYHPKLIYPTTVEELMEIGKFFDKYASLDTLENYRDFLHFEINELTVCRFAKCAIKDGNEKLKKHCFDVLIDYFQRSVAVYDFAQLPQPFATELIQACFGQRDSL